MPRIHVLQDNIINLIAAGEVVERPASVIKELVENSIDAGATTIKVYIAEGGLNQIKIEDNGCGMDAEDATMAFVQHATSKLLTEDDLEHIRSMGFRGEALASISSVSHIHLETKTADSPATSIDVRKSIATPGPSAKSTVGTDITISNLFAEVPARRKFLRATATEYNYCLEVFVSLALANLGIHFEFYHNQRLIHRLPATNQLSERVFNIWGHHTAENLSPFEFNLNGVTFTGHIGSPDVARKDRKLQYIFVNSRPVNDRLLQKAINDAYQGFIHKDLQPVYFASLHLPAAAVDVNVHPRKLEVRFRDPGPIFSMVKSSINQTLERTTKQELMQRIESASLRPFTEPVTNSPMSGSSNPEAFNSKPITEASYANRSLPVVPRPTILQSLSFTAELLTRSDSNARDQISSDSPSAASATASGDANFETSNIWQVFSTYIVSQNGAEVLFIDQHAAAEKILFEKLYSQLDTKRSKPLLIPALVELDAQDKIAVLTLATQLAEFGFEVSDFGGNSIQITSIPEIMKDLDYTRFIQEVIHQNPDAHPEAKLNLNTRPLDMIVATMACHGAVRAGQRLTQIEMQQLVADLARCRMPYNCPHGRPVSWVMTKTELEKQFKRII